MDQVWESKKKRICKYWWKGLNNKQCKYWACRERWSFEGKSNSNSLFNCFQSDNGESARFETVSQLKVASCYSQKKTKIKCIIQSGIAHCVLKKLLTTYVANQTHLNLMNQQNKLVSNKTVFNKIVTAYYGSLFVVHCSADDLVFHFL